MTKQLLVSHNFIRANSEYLHRNSEAGLAITGALTLGLWACFDDESIGAFTGLISKGLGANTFGYQLYKNDADDFAFNISNDGTTLYEVNDSTGKAADKFIQGNWFFIVGRFTPSVSLDLFVNGVKYSNTVSIPTSIFANTREFRIGSYDESNYLDGRVSNAFICASALDDNVILALYMHSRAMYTGCCYSSSTSSSSTSSSSSSTTSSSSSHAP